MEKSSENQTIAEIGPGPNPVFELFENETFKKIGEGSTYIAIDCSQEEIEKFKNNFNQKGCEAIMGDLRDLPLKSDSVDQVWLMNVFGGFQNKPKKLPDGALQWSLSLNDVFQELARVMKQKGKVYIGEINPPIGNIAWLTDEDYSDFGLEKKVYKGYEEVKSFLEKMGGRKSISYFLQHERDYLPFFIELTKK